MKIILLLAAILMCSAYGYERLWAKGDVLLSELQSGRDELYIVLFYDSTNTEEVYAKVRENQQVTSDVTAYLDSISEKGDKPFPTKVWFASVDAVDQYNQNLIYKSGVDTTALDNGPVILSLRLGKGFVQQGPKVVAALRNSVDKLRESGEKK